MGREAGRRLHDKQQMFWREVKKTRKGVEVRVECVKYGNGRVLSEENEVCEWWKEYFDGLLNVSESGVSV